MKEGKRTEKFIFEEKENIKKNEIEQIYLEKESVNPTIKYP